MRPDEQPLTAEERDALIAIEAALVQYARNSPVVFLAL